MFIVSPQDVEITKVLHPKGNLVPFLQYKGHIFCLAQSFGDNRDRAVAFSRYLTEDMGKLCVLLEEPNNFSVWSEDEIDQYPLPIDELSHNRLSNPDLSTQFELSTPAVSNSQPIKSEKEPVIPIDIKGSGVAKNAAENATGNGAKNEAQILLGADSQPGQPPLSTEADVQPPPDRISNWDLQEGVRQRMLKIIGIILLVAMGLAGLLYWIYSNSTKPASTSLETPPQLSSQPIAGLTIDTSLPNPKVLTMDGSTSMVELVMRLRTAYADRNPNIPVTYGQPDGRPGGSNQGLEGLIARSVVLAASSRPLYPKEAEAGIQVVAIAYDSIAVVVGVDNPFKGELTTDQLRRIYLGKITNWSELGGANMPIRVINRARTSGTRDIFQSTVLVGREFAPDSSRFITWLRDETTAVLPSLGKDGIYYATVSQLKEQELVRIVPIEGALPNDMATVQSGKYPISRNVYLAFPKPTSPAVKEFIDLALSPKGQQIIHQSGFMPMMPFN
ncbi:phosphate ABC transporter substrate-binding protein [Pseudanabaena sp. PCC 6802]|uniref:phosphate ABC transporter substrate-binding protein n=1 Tax=Pseudanabaena sp. PCC 6802 TaxID=118173 RepID=UPI00034DC203|nr:phosphate ABC transporter substrate-binding protein [Pseudanabaena sp. PCC 6802]